MANDVPSDGLPFDVFRQSINLTLSQWTPAMALSKTSRVGKKPACHSFFEIKHLNRAKPAEKAGGYPLRPQLALPLLCSSGRCAGAISGAAPKWN